MDQKSGRLGKTSVVYGLYAEGRIVIMNVADKFVEFRNEYGSSKVKHCQDLE